MAVLLFDAMSSLITTESAAVPVDIGPEAAAGMWQAKRIIRGRYDLAITILSLSGPDDELNRIRPVAPTPGLILHTAPLPIRS